MSIEPRKFYRSRSNRVIAGVAGGLGEYLNVDPVFVRAIFVALIFLNGIGFLLYLILAILAPSKAE